jgi:serine protease AprX
VTRRTGRIAVIRVLSILVLTLSAVGPAVALEGWQSKVDASVLEAAAAGNTEFIVYMDAKADLAPAKLLGSKVAKGTFVYEALTETAQTSQAPVVAVLENLGRDYRSFWIANTVVTSGGLAVVEAVASLSDVKAVYPVGRGELHWPVAESAPTTSDGSNAIAAVEPSINHVNANDAWTLGYTGQGAVVAGADTGVRWTHNSIKLQYRGWNTTTLLADHNYNWHNGAGANAECPGDDTQPCDDNQHGTHTVGTMVGDDGGANQIGMAPDAEWIACRNMSQGVGTVPTYMDCMEWFIAPTNIVGAAPDPSKAPDVVNNSWGCVEACAPPILKDMIDASRAAGIFYAVSAGNDNQFTFGTVMACNTINFPLAVYQSGFTVGATEPTTDVIADYSSLGPVTDNPSEGVSYRKPDIVAPGSNIRSATSGSDISYASLSGTSMAGPHVAGLVALILSANPLLRGDVDTIERIIEETSVHLPSNRGCGGDTNTQVPNNEFGWGRIDALAAVKKALVTAPPCPSAPFDDVPVDHPFCAEILWAETNDIANGWFDNTYRPENNNSRMAMAAFLARLVEADPPECVFTPFSDVPLNHTFCKEINWNKVNGVMNGFPDGTFRPEGAVTRQAMAAFLARISQANPPACTSPPFSDVSVSHPFCKEINWLKVNGIATGFEDGTFRPDVAVTRQAMAAFLFRTWMLLQ